MINKISPEIFQIHFKIFGSCVYLLKLKDKKILIDTSTKENGQELIRDLGELKIKPEQIGIILLTHYHWDHIGNLNLFPNAKIYSSENISSFPLKEITTIKTPGHSQDSLCFLYEDVLFSGDTIFQDEGRGRADLFGGSEEQILESIKKLKKMKYKTLCPGHID